MKPEPLTKEKMFSLLASGIALAEDTMKDVVDIAIFLEVKESDLEQIKNREVKTALYEYLGIFPESPVEFLRHVVNKAIGKTLLIKDKATIDAIKEKDSKAVLGLFIKYKQKYGFKRLAEIFFRYKPIFLAFRTNTQMRSITNKIRKLANKYHKPMKADYLNDITAMIKRGEKIDEKELRKNLSRVNNFRKIRLAYALKFRTKDADSILYRIRNGKGYATDFSFAMQGKAQKILEVVLDSLMKEIDVKGKKIYIPENITYALPATEKQFSGDFPSGTCISVPKDMIVGVNWKNVDGHAIDLDLSSVSTHGKVGWDSQYRTEDGKILFSGDITDARGKNGASELFYVQRQCKEAHILFVNYYNFEEDREVPFKLFVAREQVKSMKENYIVNPNNIECIAKTSIDKKQKILGLLVTTTNECRFYFTETAIGKSITSSNSEFVEKSRKYLFDFYTNTISLNEVLEKAGAKIVTNKEKCDIDLSPETLDKDKIIKLLEKKK